MAKKNRYWEQRLLAEMKAKQEEEKTIKEEFDRLHNHYYREIEKEINDIYIRYGNALEINPQEMRKKASQMDVEAFQDKARRYVEEKNFSPQANEELKIYNATMRVNRLELLQAELDLEMVALADGEYKLTEKFMNAEYLSEVRRQAGILGESVPTQEMLRVRAQAIMNVPFHGAVWSDSIWDRQELLRSVVADITQEAIIQGKNATTFVSQIRKEFDVNAYEAKRLAVTEAARVASEVQKQSYERNGYDKFIFMAEPTACDRCAKLNGKTFYTKDLKPGENASPIHPHCHCTTAPGAGRDELEEIFREYEAEKDDIIESGKASVPEIIANNMSPEQVNFYNQAMKDSSKEALKVWETYRDSLTLLDGDYRKGAHYRPDLGVNINIAEDMAGKSYSRPGNTFFHEFGHNIDFEAEGSYRTFTEIHKLQNGKTFGEQIFDEVTERIKEMPGKRKSERVGQIRQILLEEYQEDMASMSSISDLFGGATNNQLNLGVGHDTQYWKPSAMQKRYGMKQAEYRNGMLGKEGFAEMYAAEMINDVKEIEKFKKWLPESYSHFKDMLKALGGR